MIQDQYEEEFYLSYLLPRAGASKADSPSKPAPGSKEQGLIYKYYSELSESEIQRFDCRPDFHGSQSFMSERGNILGISMPNVNDWVDQILKDGFPSEEKQSPPKSAIIKLYDKNINAFKLNEQITFIGVLEFKPDSTQIDSSSSPADEDGLTADQMAEQFFAGVLPDMDTVPHLHAISCRKMAVLQCPELLRYCKVDKDLLREQLSDGDSQMEGEYLKQLGTELENAQKKLLAIFKLIFKGDETQSAYLLYNLLAKVHQKSPEGMPMGHFNINISGLDSTQAK